MKSQTLKSILPLILVLGLPTLLNAQKSKISLSEAESIAAKSNLRIVGKEYSSKFRKTLEGTSFNPEKTSINAEYGKINSIFNDNKFGVTQSFRWPSVYKRQKALLQSQTALAEAEKVLETSDILRLLRQTWVGYLYWTGRKELLEYADSLYAGSFEREELRFNAGHTGLMEKTFSENQLLQNRIEIRECITEINNRKLELKYLLNSEMDIVPAESDLLKLTDFAEVGESDYQKNPDLKRMEKELELYKKETALAKAQRSPDLSLGYNNMSIQGWQQLADNTEKYFGTGDRFGSVQLGVAIPLFGKAYSKQIDAADLQAKAAAHQTEAKRLETEKQYGQAIQQYNQSRETLKSFSELMLANAETTISLANQQLQAGSISYLEWSGNVRQALGIRGAYLDAQLLCAEQLINILYLTGK